MHREKCPSRPPRTKSMILTSDLKVKQIFLCQRFNSLFLRRMVNQRLWTLLHTVYEAHDNASTVVHHAEDHKVHGNTEKYQLRGRDMNLNDFYWDKNMVFHCTFINL